MSGPVASHHTVLAVLNRSIFSLNPCGRTLLVSSRRGASGPAWEVDTPSGKLRRAFVVLGLVQDECGVEDIRKAYIRLAKKHHPDSIVDGDPEKFIQVKRKC